MGEKTEGQEQRGNGPGRRAAGTPPRSLGFRLVKCGTSASLYSAYPAAADTFQCLSGLIRFCFTLLSDPGTELRSFLRSRRQRKGSGDISEVTSEYHDPRILWDETIKSVVYCD